MMSSIENLAEKALKLYIKINSKGDEFGRSDSAIEAIRPALNFLYNNYFRVSCSGLSHISKQKPFIIASNHSGMLPYDAAMIAQALLNKNNTDIRFLADKFVYRIPLLGDALLKLGAVPATLENAQRILASGHSLLIFPEGVDGIGKEYEKRYKLSKFKTGFARLAKEFDVPIIPAGVVGAEEIHPVIHRDETIAKKIGLPFIPVTLTFPWLGPLGLIPLPSKWVISFGKPIHPNQPVNKLVSTTRKAILDLINKGRKKRKSIWD